ncbi:type II toxin-antitoxin system RelE family toxin [Deinococcus cellulosilyticus]|uniref:Cytotoxic translational repressor of toxin-antitoxin stability system n=1 Tax=Deinococcus cellulosilyticus (strain DSM 18568 / NBRC 106333 / KACC 11606 / 5516J-15) TaxID=1223518 RepID=A0A511NAJ1_DEIC1|nr:type II toxin-antitoxin system RelE/ParE family toxin [Deinococcus cellulosilyticus]GEM49845.1 hypothetical protein DC3_54800 [Deinococcus cellulosilyticus NBRC 106333 = KACC 11606]
MEAQPYTLQYLPEVKKDLKNLKDVTTYKLVGQALAGLVTNPTGKPLSHHPGYFSIRCGKSRYRAIFRVDHGKRTVTVALVGKRQSGHHSDVYEQAKVRL